MTTYPECERMSAVVEESNRIGDFIDWLGQQGIFLARWQREFTDTCNHRDIGTHVVTKCEDGRWVRHTGGGKTPRKVDDLGPCPKCDGTGERTYERDTPLGMPIHEHPQTILAAYYEIDLDKVETERRAMLDALRREHA